VLFRKTLVGASQVKNASSNILKKTVDNFDLRTLYTFKRTKKDPVKNPKKELPLSHNATKGNSSSTKS